jgi:hypothetical protein
MNNSTTLLTTKMCWNDTAKIINDSVVQGAGFDVYLNPGVWVSTTSQTVPTCYWTNDGASKGPLNASITAVVSNLAPSVNNSAQLACFSVTPTSQVNYTRLRSMIQGYWVTPSGTGNGSADLSTFTAKTSSGGLTSSAGT